MSDQMETPKKRPLSLQLDLSKFEKASEEDKRQQEVMSESVTFFKDGMRRLRKNPLAMASIIVLLLVIITIIVAPLIVPYRGRVRLRQKCDRVFHYADSGGKWPCHPGRGSL